MERSSREASGLQSAILLFGAALYKRGAITRAERRRCEPRRPHHTVDAAAARTLPRERDRSTPSTTHRQAEGTMGAADDATRPTGDDDAAMVSPVVLAQRKRRAHAQQNPPAVTPHDGAASFFDGKRNNSLDDLRKSLR